MFKKNKVNTNEILLEILAKYYSKNEVTVEINLNKFLDIKIIFANDIYEAMVNQNSTKFRCVTRNFLGLGSFLGIRAL